jgi:acetate kinase
VKILVLNSGSSSIKFQLFDMANKSPLASGMVEQIGETTSQAKLSVASGNTYQEVRPIPDHAAALAVMNGLFVESQTLSSLRELDAIGHRVVHGGEYFSGPVRINEDVLGKIKSLSPLAPLHNPAHVVGIETAIKESGGVPQVAVFDTAFHRTLPQHAYMYALPYSLYESLHVRRYGFHGTSHHFVSKAAAAHLGISYENFNAISLHLGNGASATAISQGQSIDTSMGLSPLEGLIMGTRSGDMDPAILFYLHREKGYTVAELDALVNKQSGLKGICGNNDMREIGQMMEQGEEKAILAFEMFAYRIKKYIGAYSAALGRVDALIFTGGIGENDAQLRAKVCQGLENLGISIDTKVNNQRCKVLTPLHTPTATVATLVVPTNEELEIALQTQEIVSSGH